jgi:farnesyl-diphosphate farnesyltransferase
LTDLLGDVLRRTSRTFYLSLAILPRPLREPIGLAYLLARATDSVADTRLLPRPERMAHLRTLRAAYDGAPADVGAVGRACAPHQALAAERELLARVAEALDRVERLPADDRAAVRRVLATITEGQLFDLERFPGHDADTLTALDTAAELDRYTYLVAGCVGEFWTVMHLAHRPRLAAWDAAGMSARGVRFGKALQLTNVLRDVPADLRHGRCYLPARELAPLGLAPRDLLDHRATPRARPLIDRWLGTTLAHYDEGWRYALAIPRAEWRMRLACVWPLLIGLATLAAIAAHPDPLAAERPIKISRRAVRGILARSTLAVGSNGALRAEASRLSSPLRGVRHGRTVWSEQ